MSDPLQDRAGDDVVFQGNVWWNGGVCDWEAAWHLDQGKAMCGGRRYASRDSDLGRADGDAVFQGNVWWNGGVCEGTLTRGVSVWWREGVRERPCSGGGSVGLCSRQG